MDMRESPDARATALLRRVLSEMEWAQFTETGVLEVSGSRRTYRISPHDLTYILDSQTRRPVASACLQLSVPAPVHDRIITEYLLIQNDEDLYWQRANVFPADLNRARIALLLAAFLDTTLLVILFVQLGG